MTEASPVGYRLYLVFAIVGLGAAGYLLMKARPALDEREAPVRPQPRAVERPPVLERFPYDRNGRRAAVIVTRHDAKAPAAGYPVFWARGNLVVVDKDAWDGDDLAYSRRPVDRETFERLVLALLDGPDTSAGADCTVTLTRADGTSERRSRRADELRRQLAGLLAGGRPGKPHTVARLRLKAEPVGADVTGATWPVRRLPLSHIRREGELVSRVPEVNRLLQRKLLRQGFFRQGGDVVGVTATPVVDR